MIIVSFNDCFYKQSGLGDVKPTRERDAQDETDAAAEVSKTSSEETAEPSHPDHV